MIRRILVPLDLSEHTVAATARGLEIASRAGASVTGLTVTDIEGIKEAVALPFHAELLDYPPPAAIEMAKDAAAKLEEAREKFRQTCVQQDVACDVRRLSGSPANGILDLSRFHDLLVMGLRSHFHFETEKESGDTLTDVLDSTPVPVLLVPSSEAVPLRRALIAYDGSPESTRALHAFAKFYPVWKPEVRIVVHRREKKSGGHLLDEAQKFLQAHEVEQITTELLAGESIRHAVEDRELEWADMVVAGVRSKPRLKTVFVGSFVRYLIERGHRTLLLSL